MKHTMKLIAAMFLAGSFSEAAHAVTCTTSSPVSGQTVSDATSTIGGGGTYNLAGTADCPDQPGPQGEPGANGADGAPGPQGIQGETGAQGPQGPEGPQGVAGADGTPGAPGTNGTDGAPGAQGPQGVAGLNGADGAQGPKGDKGDAGAQGPKGDKGDQGIAGKDGKDFDPGELERGLATMGALNVPHIDIGKRFGVSGSAGFYGEETAIGAGVAVRFNETWQIGASVASDTAGKNVAGKAAISGQW